MLLVCERAFCAAHESCTGCGMPAAVRGAVNSRGLPSRPFARLCRSCTIFRDTQTSSKSKAGCTARRAPPGPYAHLGVPLRPPPPPWRRSRVLAVLVSRQAKGRRRSTSPAAAAAAAAATYASLYGTMHAMHWLSGGVRPVLLYRASCAPLTTTTTPCCPSPMHVEHPCYLFAYVYLPLRPPPEFQPESPCMHARVHACARAPMQTCLRTSCTSI